VETEVNSSVVIRRFVKEWLEYPSVKAVQRSVAGKRRMGSMNTVQVYVRGIRSFVKDYLRLPSPEVAIQKFKRGELDATALVDSFIDWGLEKWSHSTVRNSVFGIKKWLELNRVKVNWKTVELPTSSEIQEADRAPTKEQLRKLLDHSYSTRNKAAVLVLASSGLRAGTMLSLTLGDVDFDYPDVARISVVRKRGRKFGSRRGMTNGRYYCTFITPEAKETLLSYLDERRNAGEKLTPASPLIGDAYHRGKFITINIFQKSWHRMLKKAGLNEKSNRWYVLHLHTLRKFFRSNCVGVDPSYRAEEEKHLAEYRKAIPHLTIYASTLEENEMRKKAILDFARFQGYSKEMLRKLEEVLSKSRTIEEAVEKLEPP